VSDVLIIGTGDHARVIDELARAAGHSVIGRVEPDSEMLRSRDWLESHRDGVFVVAIGANEVRRRSFQHCLELGLTPLALVHPSAVVLEGATVAPGAQVCARALIGVAASIGEDAIVNSMASVDHDAVIDAHAFIGPGAALAGRVRVGTGAHVGIGAVVREGTIIGAGALVAAGAVVVADVPAGTRVAGVPARPMDT